MAEPNMVIVNIEGQLHSFDLVGGELVEPSTPFDSDYDINERQIILASYDADDHISTELMCITLMIDDEEVEVLECMQAGDFSEVVEHLLEAYKNENRTLH